MPNKTIRRSIPNLSLLLVCTALLAVPQLFAALTVTISESVIDRVITGKDPAGQTFFELRTTNSGSFRAVVTAAGLTSTNLTTNTSFKINLGAWSFSSTLGAANFRTTTSWTFIQTTIDPDSGGEVETGRILLSRSGAPVLISGTFKQLESSLVADEYVGFPGAVRGQTLIALELGDETFERNIFYKGTSSTTNRIFGTGVSALEFSLNTVQVTGTTDDLKPTLAVTSPRSGLQWSNETLTVIGKATDNIGVSEVLVKLNDQDWRPATLLLTSNLWAADVVFEPGTNFIRAVSVDFEGHHSLTSVVQVLYVFPLTLSLDLANGGTVPGYVHRQMLIPGVTYKATAAPKAGYLFNGWSGDYSQTNRVLSFVMAVERTLQANFVPNPYPARKGTYVGLFFPADNQDATNSGYLTLTVSDFGVVSGRLLMQAHQFPFTGSFNPTGTAQIVISRGTNTPLDLEMNFDASINSISGTITNQFWNAGIGCLQTIPTTYFKGGSGRYTLVVLSAQDPTNSPTGDGAASMVVNDSAVATISGSLADGTPISFSGGISRYRSSSGGFYWPVFIPLYGGQGMYLAWVEFIYLHDYADLLSGTSMLIKPPRLGDPLYPEGFRFFGEDATMRGFQYFPPVGSENIVDWTNGFVVLGGGDLPSALVNRIMIVRSEVRFVSWVATNDFTNFPGFVQQFSPAADPVSAYLWTRFSADTTTRLAGPDRAAETNRAALAYELNRIILGGSIYSAARFATVPLSAETMQLRSQNPQGAALSRFNRLLLEDAYPDYLPRSPGNTNKISMTMSPSTGTFSGSFTNPVTGGSTTFKGALLRGFDHGTGSGWFLGTNRAGGVFMSYHLP